MDPGSTHTMVMNSMIEWITALQYIHLNIESWCVVTPLTYIEVSELTCSNNRWEQHGKNLYYLVYVTLAFLVWEHQAREFSLLLVAWGPVDGISTLQCEVHYHALMETQSQIISVSPQATHWSAVCVCHHPDLWAWIEQSAVFVILFDLICNQAQKAFSCVCASVDSFVLFFFLMDIHLCPSLSISLYMRGKQYMS